MDIRQSRRAFGSICLSCRSRLQSHNISSRYLSTTPARQASDDNPINSFAAALRGNRGNPQRRSPSRTQPSPSSQDSSRQQANGIQRSPASQNIKNIASQASNEAASRTSSISDSHHLHVYATKHNTHLTLTKPNREPLLSLSAGNIGFRKSQRGSFDAAYQLASYCMGKMHERGMLINMDKLEIVLRGFGAGREAFQKALLGSEGKGIKGKVTRVTDSTRLKFGGVRSKNVRRL
jgi:small subunit ribosomal protein S11